VSIDLDVWISTILAEKRGNVHVWGMLSLATRWYISSSYIHGPVPTGLLTFGRTWVPDGPFSTRRLTSGNDATGNFLNGVSYD
jgi:hypothetical protein